MQIVELAGKVVGAAAHVAPYTRTRKRFGKDRIEMEPFTTLRDADFGPFASELTAAWVAADDASKVGALEVIRQAGGQIQVISPIQEEAFARLIGDA